MYPIRKHVASENVSNLRRRHCFQSGDNVSSMKNRIEELRKAAGVTLDQLGSAIGIGRSGMQKVQQKGVDNLKVWQLKKVAEMIKIDPVEILGGTATGKIKLSDAEIALTDTLKAIMALLLKTGIMPKTDAKEIFNYLDNHYPADMENAHAVVNLLAAPVRDKSPAKDFQAMTLLWQHVLAAQDGKGDLVQ